MTDSSGWNATFGMHRADLVEMLADALPAGMRSYRPSLHRFRAGRRACARVSFANGASAEADIVIAADGIHSELRPHVFAASEPVFSGSVAYRGLVPHRARSGLADRPLADVARQRPAFLAFPVRAGTLINYVGFVPTR